MRDVMSSLPNSEDWKLRMRKIANSFTNTRSMSAQEAVHQLLGLPLQMKTRQVIFLSSGFPKQRYRYLFNCSPFLSFLATSLWPVFQCPQTQVGARQAAAGCEAQRVLPRRRHPALREAAGGRGRVRGERRRGEHGPGNLRRLVQEASRQRQRTWGRRRRRRRGPGWRRA